MTRYSEKRQAILSCLQTTTVHPTAEWVYQQLKEDYPNISLGTVYRNLVQLKEAGLIASMGVVAGEEHFDGNLSDHAHAICTQCGRIEDIPISEEMAVTAGKIQSSTGCIIKQMQYLGLCKACYAQQQAEGEKIQ